MSPSLTMETALQELALIAHEVGRIIRSPYTPSLQPLHNILKRSSPSSVIAWFDTNPCYISALAEIILDSIRLCPGSVDILLILLPLHEQFRRACISGAPALLADCLDASYGNGDFQEQYFELSICLLSNAPERPLPAQASSFLNRFVKRFTADPTNISLRQILDLLRGGNISTWPPDCLEGIQDTAIRVLREGHDDEGTSLLCLAILAALADNSQLGNECRSQSHDFFVAKKASKSLVLGLTSSIKSLSVHLEGKRSATEVMEHLKLAGHIFEALEDKQMLLIERSICLFTRKLCEKVQKEEIGSDVQLAGAQAIAILLEDKTPQTLIDLVEKIALNQDVPRSDSYRTVVWDRFVPKFGDTFATNLIQYGMDFCEKKGLEVGQDPGSTHIVGLTGSLLQFLSKSARVRDGVRKALVAPPIQQRLRTLIKSAKDGDTAPSKQGETFRSVDGRLCSRCAAVRQGFVLLGICKLFLLACPDTDMQLSTQVIEFTAGGNYVAGHAAKRSSVSALSQPRVPLAGQLQPVDSGRWQDKLRQVVQEDAVAQAARLDNYFQAVCIDLERRCTEIEKPLREKELVIADQAQVIEDLRITVRRIQGDLQAVTHQCETEVNCKLVLQQDMDRLQDEVQHTIDDHQLTVESAKSDLEEERQLHQQDRDDHESRMRSLKEELQRETHEKESLRSELVQIRAELSNFHNAQASHTQKFRNMAEQITEANQREAKLHSDVQKLQQAVEVLTASNNEVSIAVQTKSAESDRLKIRVGELTTTSEQLANEKQRLEDQLIESANKALVLQNNIVAQNDKIIATKEQELSDQSIFYDQALEQLKQDIQQVRESASSNERQQQSVIQDLRQEVKILRQEKERRAKELAQAQSLGRQLMGLMQQPTDGNAFSPMKRSQDEISTDTLSSMLHDTRVSQPPESFTSPGPSPVNRRPGRRALSELPPQSPRKANDHERRVSWAPQHKKRTSVFLPPSLRDENMYEQSLNE